MSSLKTISKQRVRFEEVTPANTVVAFFDTHLQPLAACLQLPLFDGYDDLDEMQFIFLTLPSSHTVTVQQYEHSPRSGVNLYVDDSIPNIPTIIFEACQRLAIPRSKVIWFHPDFQTEVDQLYIEQGENAATNESVGANESGNILDEPIECFQHALKIYTRPEFPEYWAMLQHNFGLAYFDRTQGDRRENLEKAIECFQSSLLVYRQDVFPEAWRINQEDLAESQKFLELLKEQNLVTSNG